MSLFTSLSWLSLPHTILLVPIMVFTTLIIFKRSRIIGNMHQLGVLSHNSLSSLSKTYGLLMHLRLGSVPTLIISSAELAREVMKYQDLNFCSRPPFLSQKRLSYNFLDIGFAPALWRILEGDAQEEDPVVWVHKGLHLQATSFVGKLLVKCYIGGAEKSDFHKVLEETEAMSVAFFFSNFILQLGWIDKLTGPRARLEKNFFDLDAFYERVIDEHLDPKRPRLEHQDFVDVLIQVQNDHNLTRDHIKGVLMNILVAGRSTDSTTIVWAMSELIRSPRVKKKAQEEVRRVIGNKNKVEESDLAQLQYLKLVLKETLRLHSRTPLLIPRETIRHCMINGYDILPKTSVLVNTREIGRNTECWGNPDEFIPERFENSEVDYKGSHFELIPFGAGRRICPRMTFGMVTVELTMANLLYYFNWKFPSGANKKNMDMSEAPGITVHKKSDLLLVAT
ncbi:cytochrome P450 71A9-like protein [Cinnamomum micranthum f. kanehirae]|uniref:Cytochrome P450 71A9-like protein n=1 Tax=Cinnamomum micranthum f. kanehirae TaxID=337451 RepID=A0A443PWG0_9MAGN|nr:cytochrome P450 71A9-like protein [Cinnamomum micranthum f. kanehirae]